MTDKNFMRDAIKIAKAGIGGVNPNPLVGAVIVLNGKKISSGAHKKFGGEHAERIAINRAKRVLKIKGQTEKFLTGAILYVTLEPCCHFGKQPPCTNAIIDAGISRVVIGSRDPNPLVAGKGVKILREAGIKVEEDFLRNECDKLNSVFFKFITKKIPFVAVKFAMSIDGKICAENGESKWITNEKARTFVHKLRNFYSGILVGIGTVLKDDPMLDVRFLKNGRNPIRFIFDSNLRIPQKSKIVQSAKKIKTFVVCLKSALENEDGKNKKFALESFGIKIFCCKEKNGKIDFADFLKKAAQKNVDGILVEGGSEIFGSVFEANVADKIYAFLGAKILGGAGKSVCVGWNAKTMKNAKNLTLKKTRIFENDVLLEFDVKSENYF